MYDLPITGRVVAGGVELVVCAGEDTVRQELVGALIRVRVEGAIGESNGKSHSASIP
jgi:hypothetical protein